MLISTEGAIEWCAEYDEWGNLPGKDHQKFTFCTRERSSEVHFLY
ncbi:RHS family protein [Escherichia coli P0298942.3]|nr:RHS family protein [Escherichia coli P0298942.3]